MASPQIVVRLDAETKERLRLRASGLGLSVSAYVRDVVLELANSPEDKHRELSARLESLEEQFEEQSSLLTRCVRLAAASVVSAAMLRDSGQGDEKEAKRRVGLHVERAVAAAAPVLEMLRKREG